MSHPDGVGTQRGDAANASGRLRSDAATGSTALAARRQPSLTVALLCVALALVVLALTRMVPEASGQGNGVAVAVETPEPGSRVLLRSEIEGFWQVVDWQGADDTGPSTQERWVSVRIEEGADRGSVISFDGCTTMTIDVRLHRDRVELLPGTEVASSNLCGEGHRVDVMNHAHRLEGNGVAGLVVLGPDEAPIAQLVRNPDGPGESMPTEWRTSERGWARNRTTG